jgi:hypothetical protein
MIFVFEAVLSRKEVLLVVRGGALCSLLGAPRQKNKGKKKSGKKKGLFKGA